jgi:hypothetical protein
MKLALPIAQTAVNIAEAYYVGLPASRGYSRCSC